MSRFVLSAQLQLQAPRNAAQVLRQVQQQLNGVNIPLSITGQARVQRDLRSTNTAVNNLNRSTNGLARSFAVVVRRFAAFSIATRAVSLLSNKLSSAVDEAIAFEREINKISQVTGKSAKQLSGLTAEITRLSITLGVSSQELANVGRVLSQAGFKANDLSVALRSLAKTDLAPTFEDLGKTTEGAIAIFNQFGKGAQALEGQLGAINAVAGKFAVESSDLIGAVSRVGGVFSAAGGDLNELIALFTSVRSTTRESAESIATGLRTILTRIQRPTTIKYLDELGVSLTEVGGKFKGPFDAVQALGKEFSKLEQGDLKFVQIAEELGGFRQIGKVIPLIQQYRVAQEALNVAKEGGKSLDKDVETAQKSLAVQIAQLREEWIALVRSFAETGTFRTLVKLSLDLASSLAKILDSMKPLLPLLAGGLLARGVGAAGAFVGGRLLGRNQGGPIGFASGGRVPGTGNGDTVPAMLTPGEFVIKKSSVNQIGAGTLEAMNNNRFAAGGLVAQNKVAFAIGEQSPATSKNVKVSGTEVLNARPKGNQSLKGKFLKHATLNNLSEALGKNVNNGFSYTATTEGYQKDDERVLSGALNQGVKSAVETSANVFAKYLGVDKVTLPPLDNKDYYEKIDQSFKGNLFEDVISALKGEPLKSGDSNRPFDFTNGIGNLTKVFKTTKDVNYVDAKISKDAAKKKGEFTKKISGQLALDAFSGLKQISDTKRGVTKKASGGGISGQDTVPAMLTPGEYVINKEAAQRIGRGNLNQMNKEGVVGFNRGGPVGFNGGGPVSGGGGGLGSLGILVALQGIPAIVQSLATDVDESGNKIRTGFSAATDGLVGFVTPITLAVTALQAFGLSLNKATLAGLNPFKLFNKGVSGKVSGGISSFAGGLGKTISRGSGSGAFGRAGFGTTVNASGKLAGASRFVGAGLSKGAGFLGAAAGIAAPLTGTVLALTALSSGLNALLGNTEKYNDAIKEGNASRAQELAALKEVPGIIQVFGSDAATIYQDTIGKFFGGKSSTLLKAQASASATAAFADLHKAENAEKAAKALETFLENGKDASSALTLFAANLQNNANTIAEERKRIAELKNSKEVDGTFTLRNVRTLGGIFGQTTGQFNKSLSDEEKQSTKTINELNKRSTDGLRKFVTEISKGVKLGTTWEQLVSQSDELKQAIKGLEGASEIGADVLRQEMLVRRANIEFMKSLNFGLSSVNGALGAASSKLTIFADRQAGVSTDAGEAASTLAASLTSAAGFISDKDFEKSLDTLDKSIRRFGGNESQASGATDSIAAFRAVKVALPTALKSIQKDTSGANVDPGNVVNALKGFFDSGNFDRSGLDKQSLNRVLESFSPLNISSDQISEFVEQGDVTKIIDSLSGPLRKSIEKNVLPILRKEAAFRKQYIAQMRSLNAKRIATESQLVKAQQGAIDTLLFTAKKGAEFGIRGRVTSDERLSARRDQFNFAAKNAGIGGLTSGSASDIERAARELRSAAESQSNDRLSAINNGQNRVSPEQQSLKALGSTTQELVRFSKQRLDILKDELDLVKKKNSLEKSGIESLLSGDVEGFFNKLSQSQAANAIRNGGSTAGFSSKNILAAIENVRGDVSPAKLEEAILRSGKLQTLGLSGRSAGVLAGNTSEEQGLRGEAGQVLGALNNIAGLPAALLSFDVKAINAELKITSEVFNQTMEGYRQGTVDLSKVMTDTGDKIAAALDKTVRMEAKMILNIVLQKGDGLDGMDEDATKRIVASAFNAGAERLELDQNGKIFQGQPMTIDDITVAT